MQKITIVFTKRAWWNPVSWLIRWCMPRTRFYLSKASHCLIEDGDHYIEAAMLHGVRRTPKDVAMKGLFLVERVEYLVPDAEAGLAWARGQVGSKYDFKGAVGIAISPEREWAEEGSWFCYELAAATLAAAGRDIFRCTGHITEGALLSIKP